MKRTIGLYALTIAFLLPTHAIGEELGDFNITKTRYAVLTFKPNDEGFQDMYVNKTKIPTEAVYASVDQSWQIGDKDVLLIGQSSGGTACPGDFIFVILSPKKVIVSETFGNCSVIPKISRIKDSIVVTFPRMNRFSPSETTQYENGKISGMVFSKVKGDLTKKLGVLELKAYTF